METLITIEDLNGIKVAHISGQLDESNVDEKIKEIYKVIEENPKNLNMIFDLANLEYMNSKSIGYLTDLYGKITESGGQVAIASAKPNIVDILQVVGLTQLIKTFDTIEAAKLSFGATQAQPVMAQVSPVVEPQPATPQAPVQSPVAQEPQAQAPVETITQASPAPVQQAPGAPIQQAPVAPVAPQQTTPEVVMTPEPAVVAPEAQPAVQAQTPAEVVPQAPQAQPVTPSENNENPGTYTVQ